MTRTYNLIAATVATAIIASPVALVHEDLSVELDTASGTTQAVYIEDFSSDANRDATVGVNWDKWAQHAQLERQDSALQRYPAAVIDGVGNTYVVWQDRRNDDGDIYAQKIDAKGNRQWREDTHVNSALSSAAIQTFPAMALSGDGAWLLVVWWEYESVTQGSVQARLIDARTGLPQSTNSWQVNALGVPIVYPFPEVVAFGNGFFITWQDARLGGYRVFGQMLDLAGTRRWSDDLIVSDEPIGPIIHIQYRPVVAVITDTLVLAWQDTRNEGSDIYAQKLDAAGTRLWPGDVLVNRNINLGENLQRYVPAVSADDEGNAYVAWVDTRAGINLRVLAQKLLPNGQRLWSSDDVLVSGPKSEAKITKISMTTDAADQTTVAWEEDSGGIFAQRLDANGALQWNTNGLRVTPNTEAATWPILQLDAAMTATLTTTQPVVLVWTTALGISGGIYAQKLNGNGGAVWASKSRMSASTGFKFVPEGTVVSGKVGSLGQPIKRAALDVIDAPNSGTIDYFLSNNGGQTWNPISPKQYTIFTDTVGNDLRWKAVLHASADLSQTPVISRVQVDYSSISSWTFMLYLAGDNDLIRLSAAYQNLLANFTNNPNVNLAILFDGPGINDTYRWFLQKDETNNPIVTDQTYLHMTSNARESVNMGDKATLREFVKWTHDTIPADHYYLMIADHGKGTLGTAWDGQGDNLGWDANGDYLTPQELRDALAEATNDGAWKLDVLHFDACSMGLFELAYDLKDVARYMIASENLIVTYFPLTEYVKQVPQPPTGVTQAGNAPIEPEALAINIAKAYMDSAVNYGRTISVLNLQYADAVFAALDTLASRLEDAITANPAITVTLATVHADTQKFDSVRQFYEITPDDEYLDLYDLAQRIGLALPDLQGDALRLMNTISPMAPSTQSGLVVAGAHFKKSGWSPDDVNGRFYWELKDSNGIAIFFPLQQRSNNCNNYPTYLHGTLFAFTAASRWPKFLKAYLAHTVPSKIECSNTPYAADPKDSPGPTPPPPTPTPLPLSRHGYFPVINRSP